VAEVAMQTGLYAAHRIRREVRGEPAGKPFRYHDLGSAAYISRGSAVMKVGRLHLSGFLGWWGWLFIHIGFMTGFRNRFGAVLSWWYAFTRDQRQERAFTSREVGQVRDVYEDLPPELGSAAGGGPELGAGSEPGAGPEPGASQRRPA
jgi:NADH dehydrogenase